MTAGGIPYDVEEAQEKDDPATKCLVKAISGWKFPKRVVPTLTIDFPVRLERPSP